MIYLEDIYQSIILDRISGGIDAKIELIKMWKEELASLEDNDDNKEKIKKLKKYIEQGERCLLLGEKSFKLARNLEELGELERYY